MNNKNLAEGFAALAAVMGGADMSKQIEQSEARGQRKLVCSDRMPIKGNFSTWEDLERLGFVRGEEKDSLFVAAKFPEGWTRRRSNHNMWSYIVDEKGRDRIRVFYKAAFYDTDAHFELVNRYRFVSNEHEDVAGDEWTYEIIDNATGEAIYSKKHPIVLRSDYDTFFDWVDAKEGYEKERHAWYLDNVNPPSDCVEQWGNA